MAWCWGVLPCGFERSEQIPNASPAPDLFTPRIHRAREFMQLAQLPAACSAFSIDSAEPRRLRERLTNQTWRAGQV